jgi:hypothetical protein
MMGAQNAVVVLTQEDYIKAMQEADNHHATNSEAENRYPNAMDTQSSVIVLTPEEYVKAMQGAASFHVTNGKTEKEADDKKPKSTPKFPFLQPSLTTTHPQS